MKKIIFFFSMLLFLSAMSASAQVVIGGLSSDIPSKGAILDIRSNGSYGGLLLPKVMLTDITKWTPLGTSQASAMNGTMVYNASNFTGNGLTGNGVYVWDGGTWNLIASEYGVVVPVQSVIMDPVTVSLGTIGQSVLLSVVTSPSNATDQSVTWASDAPEVATVNPSTGLVKAVSNGAAIITATSNIGGKTATCTVTISGIPTIP